MSFFEKNDVMNFLPHRDPFLLVDTVDSIIIPDGVKVEDLVVSDFKPLLGGAVNTKFLVHDKLSCFEGHFPGNPVFPGVLQIEMMAQSSAFLMTACKQYHVEDTEIEVAFLRVDNVKFRKMVIPPMELRTHAKLKKVRADICQFDCQIFHGDDLVSEGEIMASLKFKK